MARQMSLKLSGLEEASWVCLASVMFYNAVAKGINDFKRFRSGFERSPIICNLEKVVTAITG